MNVRVLARLFTLVLQRFGLSRRIANEVMALGAATIASQVLAAAAVVVLTRLYTPQDFGVYGATVSIIAFVVVAGCLRYEQAIPIAESNLQAAQLLVLSLALGATVLLTAGLVLVVFQSAIAQWSGLPSIGPYIGLIVLAAGGSLISSILGAWAVRVRAFSELARTRLSQATGLVVGQSALGVAGFDAFGLLLGDALGRGAGTARLARHLWRQEAALLKSVTIRSVLVVARRYRRFPMLSGPSALINVVNQYLPTLAVIGTFGATTGGLYVLASRVGSLPNALTMAAVAPVFVAQSAAVRQDPDALRILFHRTARRLLLIGVGPATALVLAAPPLFPIVFGQEWAAAGVIAAIFAPMFLVQLVTAPLSGILSVLERQDLHLAREVFSLVLLAGVTILASTGEWTVVSMALGLSGAGTLGAIAYLVVMEVAVHQARAAP